MRAIRSSSAGMPCGRRRVVQHDRDRDRFGAVDRWCGSRCPRRPIPISPNQAAPDRPPLPNRRRPIGPRPRARATDAITNKAIPNAASMPIVNQVTDRAWWIAGRASASASNASAAMRSANSHHRRTRKRLRFDSNRCTKKRDRRKHNLARLVPRQHVQRDRDRRRCHTEDQGCVEEGHGVSG